MLLCDADYSPEFGLQLKPPALKVPRREFLGGAFLKLTPRQKDDSHCGNLHLFHITTSAEITISTLPLRNGLNLAQQGPNLGPTSTCIANLGSIWVDPGPPSAQRDPLALIWAEALGLSLAPVGAGRPKLGPTGQYCRLNATCPLFRLRWAIFPPCGCLQYIPPLDPTWA